MKYVLYIVIVFVLSMAFTPSLQAANFDVATAAELISAITIANSNTENDVIRFLADITLTTTNNSTIGNNGLPVILNDGTLTIEGDGYTLSRAGGANFRFFYLGTGAVVTINNLTLSNGFSNLGGAIHSTRTASLTINNSSFLANRGSVGGAIYSSSILLEASDSLFSDNIATAGGGAIASFAPSNSDILSLTGNDFSNNQAGADGGALSIFSGDNRSINNNDFSNNQAGDNGGAAYIVGVNSIPLVFAQNNFLSNSAGDNGGALYIGTSMFFITISESNFISNTAWAEGGAVAIEVFTGLFTISASSFSSNSAGFNGGAISADMFEITNSSFYANTAGIGGAIYSASTMSKLMTNVSVAGNTATTSGGGIAAGASLEIRNSIIAGNIAPADAECSSTVISLGYNLFGTNGASGGCPAGASDTVASAGIASILLPIADNGGLSQTMALVAASPALDRANAVNCSANDQRGIARGADGNGIPDNPQVGDCDIGAFEYVALPLYSSNPIVATPINLGASIIGNAITALLEISQLGDSTLLVSLDSITGANAGDFTVIGLATSLENGDAPQEIGIVCTPSTVGNLTATLTLATNDPTQPLVSYTLNCEGLPVPVVNNTVTVTLPNGETVVVNAETEYILKTVDNPFATLGETVTYTIRARNPKTTPLTQVVIYDIFDERLANVRLLSTTYGVAVFNGNTLTVSGFSLQPNEEAVVMVSARVAALRAGDTIPNAAILESPDASVHVSNLALVGANPLGNAGTSAQVFLIPSQLPSTGESPFWRNGLLILLAVLVFAYLGQRLIRQTAIFNKRSS